MFNFIFILIDYFRIYNSAVIYTVSMQLNVDLIKKIDFY